MNLIDIFVEELPKRGGWPEGATRARQSSLDTEIYITNEGNYVDHHNTKFNPGIRASDCQFYGGGFVSREQYEAALAAKNEGWIAWGGGECPVQTGVLVDVRYDDGVEEFALEANMPNKTRFRTAAAAWWRKDGSSGDIIAYRLHQPQEAEKTRESEEDLNDSIGQAPAPLWNGEGLPPVGMEIEYKFAKANYRTDFSRGKVLAYGVHNVFMEHLASKNEFIQPLDKIEFRPIRSEADRKREEAIMSLAKSGGAASFEYGEKFNDGSLIGAAWYELYDAIAAGKVRGVKLED